MSTAHRYGLSHGAMEQLSVDLEVETGYDSIPTIERMYDGGCCFPNCEFRTRDVVAMWRHVHFGRKHGQSFGLPLAELVRQREKTIGSSA